MAKRFMRFLSVVTASVIAFSAAAPSLASYAADYEWHVGADGKYYWYEFGEKQGTYSDPQGVLGDGTVRGREIYDSASDGWYWLDSCYDGAKAVGKEVWMPYVYQNEANFSDADILNVAYESDPGLESVVFEAIVEGTGKWVRYDENGKMIKGWVTIEGALADIYTDQVGNTYYYDTKTGIMAKGDLVIAGKQYHFDPNTGVCTNYDGKKNNTTVDLSNRANATEGTGEIVDLEEGSIAPDFTVQLANGETFTLSEHDDELTLLNFWATWCGPCVREMPALQQISDENIEGVNIICINRGEYKSTVDSFIEDSGFTMNIGYDTNRTICSYYPTNAIPYTVIVKNGVVLWERTGSMNYNSFKYLIDEYK